MSNQKTRLEDLRALGFSEAMIAVASGAKPHSVFNDCCNAPHYIYHGGRGPKGMTIIPIWEEGMIVVAATGTKDRIKVIRFSLESPEDYTVWACSERGLWAELFASMLDDWYRPQKKLADVREAANEVGFRELQHITDFIDAHRDEDNYIERLRDYIKTL